jgi:serine/threonine protein kinase/outer membrane protein assembly factor BamB
MNEELSSPEALFAAALERAGEAERRAFLDAACAGNPVLRQEVESLLHAHEHANSFMENQAMLGAAPGASIEKAGDHIGRYRLLEQIGEGGFGLVWMAEQEEPVRRRVALKIIKLGMDTREVVARFEAERQALAMMDHPNIARVFDGGATETGRPYFVMELVKGIPITKFCDERKLSTSQRLELFMQICHAVQHAHQKGIIHRDLKPTNVLVTVQDDRPLPKVIDFGVAKATQARLTEKTLFTRFNQWIGTPAYMSPEQAGLGSLDVDTRSDIYSLGVLLYELLTGRTPFDTQKLLAAGYDAVMRTIRQEEPPKPSTRLSTLAEEEARQVAAQRQAEPAKLGRLVRGDLDWIVMKALEKDRTRRYETPDAMARDLRRHLEHEPVTAAAPSPRYRLAKFVRRHHATLSRASAGFLIAAALFSGLVWFKRYREATRARESLNRAAHVVWEQKITGVYQQDFSLTATGARAISAEPHLFLRLKGGAGGWNVFDLARRAFVPSHARNVAYVKAEDGKRVFELALADDGLVCGVFGSGSYVPVVLPTVSAQALNRVIAAPQATRDLVVCAVPDAGIIFAFTPESGQVAWQKSIASLFKPEFAGIGIDQRIGYLAVDSDIVAAGMWGTRVCVLATGTGQFKWGWKEPGNYGNSLKVVVTRNKLFAFSASGSAYAFDKQTSELLWGKEVGRCDFDDRVVVHRDNLVLMPAPGFVAAISQADGVEKWRTQLLSDDWGGSLICPGDMLVVAAGIFVQRLDPLDGRPRAYVELPTAQDTVTVHGEETPVFVSHPPLVLHDETVCALTVDGSLWNLSLPATATNHPPSLTSKPAKPKPLKPAPAQLPALPPEVEKCRQQLADEGLGRVWANLRAKIETEWEMGRAYVRGLDVPPRVIIGRVVAPGFEDPRMVLAQMEVLEGGYFASAVNDLQHPVGFRLAGCLPTELSLQGKSGELIWVGDVVMTKAEPEQLGGIRGRVRFSDDQNPAVASVRISIATGSINTPSNGTDPRSLWPEPRTVALSAEGAFSVEGLSPTDHRLTVEAQGYVGHARTVRVETGKTTDLGEMLLERR